MSTPSGHPGESHRVPALAVINPSGNRSRMPLDRLPFLIGRHADNHLVLRDNRASRNHARILVEGGSYFIEDLNSRHGTWVNGERVARRALHNSDRIDFGVRESYQLTFTLGQAEIQRILEQIGSTSKSGTVNANNLAK